MRRPWSAGHLVLRRYFEALSLAPHDERGAGYGSAFRAAVALVLLALSALVTGPLASRSGAVSGFVCHSRLSVIAHGQGSPDDLAWDGSKLLVSDINRGTVDVVTAGHAKTLIGHIREPEGIVARPAHVLVVAEQASNRLLRVDLKRHSIRPLLTLPSQPKQTGVDDIEAAPDGAIYVPDSENGRLYLLRGRRLTLLAAGMIRPVGAIRWRDGIAVADEYSNAIWMVAGRPVDQCDLSRERTLGLSVIYAANRCAARARALAATTSRSFGGAEVCSSVSNRDDAAATVSTARSKASALLREGLSKPLTFRTY